MKIFHKACIIIFLIVALFMASMVGSTQTDNHLENLIGNWEGKLTISGMTLRVVFKISMDAGGKIIVTMDSPDQGIKGIPVEDVQLKNKELHLGIKSVGGYFEGIVNNDLLTISGHLHQSGQSFPITLKRVKQEVRIKRPQEPQKPYPYFEEEVTYMNKDAGITLAGTLTLPAKEGLFPVVILISGSGTQDRDETILNHKPFLVLSDYLTRLGIAVLRVDDRGIGGSTGGSREDITEDFAGDVISGIEYLKNRKEINPQLIGLIGHSEGGIIAPMVAAKNHEIAFVIMLGGTGLSGEEVIYLQAAMLAKASGASDELINLERNYQEKLFNILKEETNNSIAEAKMRNVMTEMLGKMSEDEKIITDLTENDIESQLQVMLSPWYRNFLFYDPKITLKRVICPVLAIVGEKDLQVAPKENLQAIEEALKSGNNKDYKVIEIPNLNHLLQTAKTGSPAEYGKIEETISPEVLELVGQWILEKTGKI